MKRFFKVFMAPDGADSGAGDATFAKTKPAESGGDTKAELKYTDEQANAHVTKAKAQKLADANKEAKDALPAAEAHAVAAEIKTQAMVSGVDPAKVDRAVKLIPAYDGDNAKTKVEAFLKENLEFKAIGMKRDRSCWSWRQIEELGHSREHQSHERSVCGGRIEADNGLNSGVFRRMLIFPVSS